MKFRFHPSNAKKRLEAPDKKRRALRLRGITTVRVKKITALVPNYSAEDFGIFESNEKRRRFSSLQKRIRAFFKNLSERIRGLLQKEPRVALSTLFKVFWVTLGVTVFSGITIVFSLFFTYGGAYSEVEIPNFISLPLKEATSLSNDIFEYETVYESNPEYESGAVISQKPSPGVLRKLYKKNGKLKITLTVNKENEYITLPSLSGKPLREALLVLREAGIKTQVIKEHSPTVPSGTIISSSLPAGTKLKKGAPLTLRVSLGKEILTVSMPLIVGKSEQEAYFLLEDMGLSVDEVKYESSEKALGTVISQSISAGTQVLEKAKVSFSVSKGPYYSLN